MAKRKSNAIRDSDNEALPDGASDNLTKAEMAHNQSVKEEGLESDENSSPAKKPKKEESRSNINKDDSSKKDENKTKQSKGAPDVMLSVELGKKKRATVSSFKGIPLLDIREYYGPEGEEKPGKKGISLTLEQWKLLKDNANLIDNMLLNAKPC